MSARLIKWGILGTSMISGVMAKAIQESSVSQLASVGSRSLSTAENFATEFSIPHFSTSEDLLANPDIDVIYIGLPNHLHKEWIIRCAQAGKHILCEKPLVLDLQEARDIYTEIKKNNVFCMEALMYRCHPFIKKLQDLIQENVIGEIRSISASYMANIAALANTTKGGAILNLGCYPMSLIRLLANAEPIEMLSIGSIDRLRNNDNHASAVLKFPNQITATVTTADDIGMFSQFDVYGTKGHLKVVTNPWLPTCDHNQILIFENNKSQPTEINVKAEQSLYAYQIDAVSNGIINGSQSATVSWEESIGNIAALSAWRQQVFAAELTI